MTFVPVYMFTADLFTVHRVVDLWEGNVFLRVLYCCYSLCSWLSHGFSDAVLFINTLTVISLTVTISKTFNIIDNNFVSV